MVVGMVLFGEDGAVAHLQKNAVVMVCSTVSPAFAKGCAERVEALGLHYLDAPISGSAVKAQEGALSVMASGTAAAFARARPVLEATAETVHELGGEAGPGSAYKMINQLLAGVHIAAAASQLFIMAAAAGMGGLDDSAVAKVYEKLSDIELPEGKCT
jgi:L-threonate 2-dehydrogenase